MLRWLFNFAAALSLLLLLAICAIWVRSLYWTDQKTLLTPQAMYEVMSGSGGVVLYRLEPPDGEVRLVRPAVTHSILGAEIIEGRLARRRPWKLLLVPYWLPAGVATVLPALWLTARGRREAKLQRIARCPVCGQELVPNQHCPACPPPASNGAAPPAPAPGAVGLNPQPVAYRRAVG